jgi:hypothetical protein
MIKTVNLNAEIPPSRKIHVILPDDVPVGPAEIVLVVSSRSPADNSTLADLAKSEFFGMWADRADICDSADFASHLRGDAWQRSV